MIPTPHFEAEVSYRHQRVHTEYVAAQRAVSISGLRQILGNSIIAMGTRVHGMAQCPEAAETRALIRSIITPATAR